MHRASIFCSTFLNPDYVERLSESPAFSGTVGYNGGLLSLVRKLQHALNKVEKLPVLLNEISGTVHGLKYLTQPLKLKLQKRKYSPAHTHTRTHTQSLVHSSLYMSIVCFLGFLSIDTIYIYISVLPIIIGGSDPNLIDYSENTVLIEPLASVNAIIEFLTARVRSKSIQGSNNVNNNSNNNDNDSTLEDRSSFYLAKNEKTISKGSKETSADWGSNRGGRRRAAVNRNKSGNALAAGNSLSREVREGRRVNRELA